MSRILILMYHSVAQPRSAAERSFCCRPERFARQMRHLRQSGMPVLSLDELIAGYRGQRELPERGVVVTFDDGFGDFYRNAMPILLEHRIPATLFMVSGGVGGRNDWQSDAFSHRELLSPEQLAAVRDAGFCIGSHTRSHPRLPLLAEDPAALRQELEGSKRDLEDRLGTPVRHFAYPYGQFTPQIRDAVAQAGYHSACSVQPGFNQPGTDPFALRRIDVFGTDSLWQFRLKLRFGANEVSAQSLARYYGGRLWARVRPATPPQ